MMNGGSGAGRLMSMPMIHAELPLSRPTWSLSRFGAEDIQRMNNRSLGAKVLAIKTMQDDSAPR